VRDYALWSAAVCLALGAFTWLVLRFWGGQVEREIGEAQRIVDSIDAEVLARADARRQAEMQRAMLLNEVDHRAKNALAVVVAMVRLSRPRDAEAAALAARIAALARAHELLAENGWIGAGLRVVAQATLAPQRDAGTILVEGADLPLAPGAVQPLAIVLHELANNAVRFGALSAGGTVELRWHVEGGLLLLSWRESGGPAILAPPAHRGFGSRIVEATLRDQLGGQMERRWPTSGLVLEAALPTARLLREDAAPVATAA
jgi:two-component sensor histidine kinase